VDAYRPDQQGCLERRRHDGGSLSVPYAEESLESNLVRVGAAKTKGKLRVVTMQSARVKRVLTPVHNALYDHLSSFGWLVRGEVTKEDFQKVRDDRKEGESHVSGDYESATNRINIDAVQAIVSVLLESEGLSDEEACVLRESFTDLRWIDPCSGASGSIRRGSMMGNLVSFPLLCLLNKACYDIVCDVSFGTGARRVGRFNGDDCMFNGDRQFYQLWRRVTSTFGLVVNEKKTSFTLRYLELNSRTFNCRTSRIVSKPVLSFLRRKEDSPDCIITDIFKGLEGFRDSVVWFVLSVVMRHEITIRQTTLDSIPKRWRIPLLKRRWFRSTFTRGPTPVREKGYDKSVPTVVAAPPADEFYPAVTRAARVLERRSIDSWKGVRAPPLVTRIDRRSLRAYLSRSPFSPRVSPGTTRWSFLWPKELFEFFFDRYRGFLLTDRDRNRKWLTDHPFLVRESRCVVPPTPSHQYPVPDVLLPDCIPEVSSGGTLFRL
jgi:hypothetical protein